jgi:hypothetical protein
MTGSLLQMFDYGFVGRHIDRSSGGFLYRTSIECIENLLRHNYVTR